MGQHSIQLMTTRTHIYAIFLVCKNLSCISLIEVPYYATKNDDVCIYCGSIESLKRESKCYPLFDSCIKSSKKKIQMRATKNSTKNKKK